jgi:hypothetical protein
LFRTINASFFVVDGCDADVFGADLDADVEAADETVAEFVGCGTLDPADVPP